MWKAALVILEILQRRPKVHSPKTRWWPVLVMAGLVIAVGVTFASAVEGGYVGLDDGNNIFLNQQLGGLSWARITWAFGDLGSARRYLPLGWLGFSAVFTWQGLAPFGYHAASLAWHMFAAVMLFAATRNILRVTPPDRDGWTTALAALVAAAWAAHPMRTEAVAWASGLLYTQATGFALVALWLWTLRWDFPAKAGWFSTASCLALAASLLTYPIALGLPVVCWLLDLGADRKNPAVPASTSLVVRYRIGPGLAGMLLVAGSDLAANLFARGQNSGNFAATASMGNFGLLERAEQALYVWGRYLVQLVWPRDLSPVYTDLYSLHPSGRGVILTALLSVGLLGAIGWLAWRRRISPGPAIAYSVMTLPFLGLLEHPWIAHDRYAMLLHPVCLIAGARWLLHVKASGIRLGGAVAALGMIGAGAFLAHSLVGVWKNPWTMHERLQRELPRDAWAGYYLGAVPVSVLFLDGRFAEIDSELEQAEKLAPGWSGSSVRKEYDVLIRQHEDFLRQNWPGRVLAPLAVLHFLHGKAAEDRQDWITARAHFEAALRVAADFGEARRDLLWCDRQRAAPAGK
jgi:hypothetical protein